ncbi:MAG: MarR family transcriptional regulator [Cyanobacteria bacterium SIG30]|nr:MarR family transcriptional regulator [Cyanobacteria bacterium SIG30]
MSKEEKKLTKTLFYEIEQTAKYFKFLIAQLFDKFEIKIPIEKYVVMEILVEEKELCQRDIAKKILRDRANTGKILASLEQENYIERFIDTKCGRLVKKIKLTKKGEDFLGEINTKLSDVKQYFECELMREERTKIIESLRKMRMFMKENVEIKI